MASKIFLDANVLLDFILQRENFDDAKQIMTLIVDNKTQGYITSSVLHIAGYWVSKSYSSSITKTILLDLLVDIRVIDIPHQIAVTALNSKMRDIEDSLQYYTAIHHQLDCFISSDKQLKSDSISVLPVYTPKEFLKKLT